MLSYEQALNVVLLSAKSFGQENIRLEQSLGRVLAEDIFADRDYPPFNRASMDGYAIRFIDFENGVKKFKCMQTVFAGQICHYTLQTGECFKIMTGASVPESADAVIRIEDTKPVEFANSVCFNVTGVRKFQNIALKGQDSLANTLVLPKGTRITPQVIGTLTSFGKGKILLEKLPRVTIISTGDEIVGVDEPISDVTIRNSNQYVLRAMLLAFRIEKIKLKCSKDNKTQLREKLKKAVSESDILLMSGGVSAGDADFVPQILEEVGVKKIFHKINIRPGKPIWFGQKLGGCTVFALPGNPLSCQTTFKIFVEPFLMKCFGSITPEAFQIPMAEQRIKKTALDEFFPVVLHGSPMQAHLKKFNGSGDITAGLFAEGMAWQRFDKTILEKGDSVSIFLF